MSSKGTLKLFLEDDYKIKSPLIKREIELNFIQHFNNKKKIIEFKSKNQNYVEFEFGHQSDTLIGLIIEHRQIDTLINGEQMVRMIESMIPVDNKIKTDNVFIDAFELNKNER